MKIKCSKEEFNKLFPDCGKKSKERLRRFLANQILIRGYSLKQTHQIVHQQIP